MLLSMPAAALAQDNTTPSTNTAADSATARAGDDRGFDWGWLGLLGLIGLAGLMRKDRPVARTTTSPTGTNRV
jgi:MYXO-CTERM domain-containing protein